MAGVDPAAAAPGAGTDGEGERDRRRFLLPACEGGGASSGIPEPRLGPAAGAGAGAAAETVGAGAPVTAMIVANGSDERLDTVPADCEELAAKEDDETELLGEGGRAELRVVDANGSPGGEREGADTA